MKKFKVIYPNGSSVMLSERPSLDEMQKIIGGYIELVKLERSTMWVNEDGIRLGLPRNEFASVVSGQSIVGVVILEFTVKQD